MTPVLTSRPHARKDFQGWSYPGRRSPPFHSHLRDRAPLPKPGVAGSNPAEGAPPSSLDSLFFWR